MKRLMTAAHAATFLFLVAALAAGCISWMSAEPQPDGSAIVCARVEPTPTQDAGADAAPSIGPAMRYVPAHAPVGTETPAR